MRTIEIIKKSNGEKTVFLTKDVIGIELSFPENVTGVSKATVFIYREKNVPIKIELGSTPQYGSCADYKEKLDWLYEEIKKFVYLNAYPASDLMQLCLEDPGKMEVNYKP